MTFPSRTRSTAARSTGVTANGSGFTWGYVTGTHLPGTITGLKGETVSVQITVTLGGALFPEDGSTAGELWRAAMDLGTNKATEFSPLVRRYEGLAKKVREVLG